VLFTGRQGTNSNLFSIDVEGGGVRQRTEGTGSLRVGSFSKDRTRMSYAFQDFNTPADLYVSATRKHEPTRVTHANPLIEDSLLLAEARAVRWTSSDGLEIEGLLVVPPDQRAHSPTASGTTITCGPGLGTSNSSPM
jgi:dipeptidyl aminopeptidase/acylaminoacyl peptidase